VPFPEPGAPSTNNTDGFSFAMTTNWRSNKGDTEGKDRPKQASLVKKIIMQIKYDKLHYRDIY